MVEVSTEGRRIDPVTFLVTVNLETFQKLLISDKAYFPEMNLSKSFSFMMYEYLLIGNFYRIAIVMSL